MAVETQILVNNYGINQDFAARLLSFTNGDLEGAISILESAERDVFCCKVKFLSSKKLLYGSIVLFYNFQTNLPEYMLCAVTSDSNMSKLRVEGGWRDFTDGILTYLQGKGSDPDAASRIEADFLSQANITYITSFFANRASIDLVNLKRFFINVISKVIIDEGIVLKMVTEELDVFKYRNMLTIMKVGLKILPKKGVPDVMLFNMKIEPVLAPIGGIDVERLLTGDEIIVKCTDERDVAKYIIELLGNQTESGTAGYKTLFGRVVMNQKSVETDNNIIHLQFGPGIYGTLVVGNKIRVQPRNNDDKGVQRAVESKNNSAALDNASMDKIRSISNFDQPMPGDGNYTPSTDNPEHPKKQNMNILIAVIMAVGVAFIVILLIIFSM